MLVEYFDAQSTELAILNQKNISYTIERYIRISAKILHPGPDCSYCMDHKVVYRNRKTMIDWMDGRGNFDILNCHYCKGNDNWVKCSHDPGSEFPGIRRR